MSSTGPSMGMTQG
ncbi:rCG62374 [Rattus norvegicus]|uniref:RCG62374 n=1 Tax=Rattus norvegicus TaxID=10116 RepID=A6HC82_RAT|nr:rCG62374 [Rattus norvegicus]